MKLFSVAILTLAIGSSGCITRLQSVLTRKRLTKPDNAMRMPASPLCNAQRVVVIGPVQNPEVQWTEGLTLAQAILAANCTGHRNPKEIILTRQGETTWIDPKDLLRGNDVPLQPGDTITIR